MQELIRRVEHLENTHPKGCAIGSVLRIANQLLEKEKTYHVQNHVRPEIDCLQASMREAADKIKLDMQ